MALAHCLWLVLSSQMTSLGAFHLYCRKSLSCIPDLSARKNFSVYEKCKLFLPAWSAKIFVLPFLRILTYGASYCVHCDDFIFRGSNVGLGESGADSLRSTAYYVGATAFRSWLPEIAIVASRWPCANSYENLVKPGFRTGRKF